MESSVAIGHPRAHEGHLHGVPITWDQSPFCEEASDAKKTSAVYQKHSRSATLENGNCPRREQNSASLLEEQSSLLGFALKRPKDRHCF